MVTLEEEIANIRKFDSFTPVFELGVTGLESLTNFGWRNQLFTSKFYKS